MLSILTLVSLVIAAVMTVVAWRLAREQRRRSDARVAALAAEVRRGAIPDLPLHAVPVPPLLVSSADTNGRSRIAAVIAIGVFLVGSVAALAVVMSGTPSSPGSSATSTITTTEPPLELLALGHERDGGTLTIRGVVRNPAGSAEIDNLAAVVFLFGPDGAFTTSMRAPVERPVLPAGAVSPFRIVVPDAGAVSRYRVSFRTDHSVVAHVDRRGPTGEDHR